MFTAVDRVRLRDSLLDRARADDRVVGAALVGSAASGTEDAYSDIDLALRLTPGAPFDEVVADWSEWMRRKHSVVATMDLGNPGALYRVFLLASTLQIDLSFWDHDQFGSNGRGPFAMCFGEEPPLPSGPRFNLEARLGMAWLYALHVRSALARGRTWQALYMINGLREEIASVWAFRAGLDPVQGRGLDALDATWQDRLHAMVPGQVTPDELRLAYGAALDALSLERPDLADVLKTLRASS